ncbi:MAG: nucleoside triphosphate pyrophosphohydrolase family protein [Kiritimatiellae bacterium]|nr:nucleoside triphosphate pyrophosphohydrolase family protein [Kiritimatiellia bacterium]MDW8458893.1 nucleoside triphosphate pyrophosphohydrolase family protein [Verrucomicrobiota bacterium]
MTFDEYQEAAARTAVYPGRGQGNWVYPALGLAGEAGEVCEKVKKCLRDDEGRMSPALRDALSKELGDVLWYISAMCSELGLRLEDVARENAAKLASRRDRGALHGSGDHR